jgi:hypothetical protein
MRAPATLPSEEKPVPIVQKAEWILKPIGRVQKLSTPPGFELRTIRPVDGRYTVYAILTTNSEEIPFSVAKRPELKLGRRPYVRIFSSSVFSVRSSEIGGPIRCQHWTVQD